jgi:hypothetical protein
MHDFRGKETCHWSLECRNERLFLVNQKGHFEVAKRIRQCPEQMNFLRGNSLCRSFASQSLEAFAWWQGSDDVAVRHENEIPLPQRGVLDHVDGAGWRPELNQPGAASLDITEHLRELARGQRNPISSKKVPVEMPVMFRNGLSIP